MGPLSRPQSPGPAGEGGGAGQLPSPGLPSAAPQPSSSSSFTGNERFGFATGLVPGCGLGLLARELWARAGGRGSPGAESGLVP